MQNVWDFREIGLSKKLFSDATAEDMEDSSPPLRGIDLCSAVKKDWGKNGNTSSVFR